MSEKSAVVHSTTGTIIDRRVDGKGKSTANKHRFERRSQAVIRQKVRELFDKRGFADNDEGGDISIPGKDLAEPEFNIDRSSGEWDRVLPGNTDFVTGDSLNRPSGGGSGGGGSGAGDSDDVTEDEFSFRISREEFLKYFFEDLALPNLVKEHLTQTPEYKVRRAGFTKVGIDDNLDPKRTYIDKKKRAIGARGGLHEAIRVKEEELEDLLDQQGEGSSDVIQCRKDLEELRRRLGTIPPIDPHDFVYHGHMKVPRPTTQAVMFCLMDVSGSMDEEKKNIAKRFFFLLYMFLTRTYEHIEVVFIRHHTAAEEVDEETFFHKRESGGTVASTALELMSEIITERYASGWNIYGAQASDGDNWDKDSSYCKELLIGTIMPLVQYYAYVEIANSPQNLWEEYEKVKSVCTYFAMQRIRALSEIFPVFHDLFKKEGVIV